jgi:hypothetical protein
MSPDDIAPDAAYWPPRWRPTNSAPHVNIAPIDFVVPIPVRVMLAEDPYNRQGRYYVIGGRTYDETRDRWSEIPKSVGAFLESIKTDDLADVRMALLHASRIYEDKT